MSELIGEYTGRGIRFNGNVVSSGDLLLIDFHLNDSQIASYGASCYAGFIGYVEVIGRHFKFYLLLSHILLLLDPPNVTLPVIAESSIIDLLSRDHHRAMMRFNLTHLFVFLFCGIIFVISVFLLFQYVFRYHRYQLAKNKEEVDSPLNTPHGSTVSLTRNPQNGAAYSLKAVSTSTLMSEVVTLVKLKPSKKTSSSVIRHQKLRESIVSQDEDFEKNHLNDSIDSIGAYSK